MKRRNVGRRKMRAQLLTGCHRRCQGQKRRAGPPAAGAAMPGTRAPRPGARRGRAPWEGAHVSQPSAKPGVAAAFEGALSGGSRTGQEGARWVSRSPLCWEQIRESCGLPAESTPRSGHATQHRRARRTGTRVPPAGRTPPAQDPRVRCGDPRQAPVRATWLGQACFRSFLDSGVY